MTKIIEIEEAKEKVTMFYAVSEGSEPQRIYFSFEDAKSSGAKYIDVFDKGGIWVKAYMLTQYDSKNYFYTEI